MTRKRSNLLQDKIQADERRFRFRARFERPPGDGIWNQEKTLLNWLDERLGKGNYAFHSDIWEGHGRADIWHAGRETYALHFDDHTIIPDLLKHYASITLPLPKRVQFGAPVRRQHIQPIRAAIADLQSRTVDKINAIEPRAVWTMGKCTFLPTVTQTIGDRIIQSRIQALSAIDTKLATHRDDEAFELVLDDEERGALELGIGMLQDLQPVPVETIHWLRQVTLALNEKA